MVNKTRIRRDAKRGKNCSGKSMREEFQKSENERQFVRGKEECREIREAGYKPI